MSQENRNLHALLALGFCATFFAAYGLGIQFFFAGILSLYLILTDC